MELSEWKRGDSDTGLSMGDAEEEARASAFLQFDCGCGYWDGHNLLRPHPKCSCEHAERLREEAK